MVSPEFAFIPGEGESPAVRDRLSPGVSAVYSTVRALLESSGKELQEGRKAAGRLPCREPDGNRPVRN